MDTRNADKSFLYKPGDIVDHALERPGTIKVFRIEPVAAAYKTELVPWLRIEQQAPAFLSHLNTFSQAADHS